MKNRVLTIFFMLLTISIGLVSVNLPLAAEAQNSALSQNGGGAAEQDTEKSQSSEQNGQVISGDSSIASGNNLSCEDQAISDTFSERLNICDIDGINAAVVLDLEINESRCDVCVVILLVSHTHNGITEERITGHNESEVLTRELPIGDKFSVSTRSFGSDAVEMTVGSLSDCKIKVIDSEPTCIGRKGPLTTNIHITLS